METVTILSAEQVRAALAPLNLAQLKALAETSGVPMPTIYKIRQGDIVNPGVDTVRKFMLHLQPKPAPATTA